MPINTVDNAERVALEKLESKQRENVDTTPFDKVKPHFRNMLSHYRNYPDLFLDSIRSPDALFGLTPFQRVYIRVLIRNKKVGIVATRGTSKTYVDVLAKYVKCILYPNNHEAIAMPTKNQSSKVTQEKITEIWRDYPALINEVRDFSFQKDYVKITFKNGSTLDTLTVGESSRGLRANGISLEEIVDPRMDRDTINEVILPILAQPRRTKHGVDPNEVSLTQSYVTTASHKQSYAYEKFKEIFDEMVSGKNSILLIASYEMGVRFGTLRLEEVQEKMESATYSPLSFDREMRSIFTGSSEASLVSSEDINNARILETPENHANKKKDDSFYVLAYDVARSEGNQNAQSSLVVIKVVPRGDGSYARHIVNIFTMEGSHFKNQALFLKQKVEEFKASILVVDSNGLGKGVVDYLVTEIDENPPYSVVNDDRYNAYKTPESIPMLFLVSSQSKDTKNTDIVNRFMISIKTGEIKLLKSESIARGLTKEREDSNKLVEFLLPFVQTDRLVDEVMNLEYVQSGNNTTVKQVSTAIQKDRYSALAYGNFYVYLLEQKNNKRKGNINADAMRFFSMKKPKYDVFNKQSNKKKVQKRKR